MPEIHCRFLMAGSNGDPSLLTKAFGVEPTEAGQAGELSHSRQSGGRTYLLKDSFWELGSLTKDTYEAATAIREVVQRLRLFSDKLMHMKGDATWPIRRLSIYLYFDDSEPRPYINIESEDLLLLGLCDIELEVSVS